jgi:cell division protein FtsW
VSSTASTIVPGSAPSARVPKNRIQIDPMITMLTGVLLLFGIIMVGSASVALAAKEGNPFSFLEKQLAFGLAGVVVAAWVVRIPTEIWQKNAYLLLGVSLALLLLVLIPGVGAKVNGSRRWLHLFGANFQASEASRVLIFIYLCSYLVRREEEIRETLMGIVKPLLMLGAACALLLAEPDLGAGIVIMLTGLTMLFLAGAQLRYLAGIGVAVAMPVAIVVWLTPWRLARMIVFLNPWKDPEGTGYQLTQALMAIGRGEWFGVGLGGSIQKLLWLPEAHTDFVFSVYAEEFGFFAVALLILLFLALSYRALAIARDAADAGLKFQSYLAASFGVWIALQAFVNVAVNLGALPTKGLTLPLLSYGRSSLLVTLAWVGVVLRVHHETQSSRTVALRSPAR